MKSQCIPEKKTRAGRVRKEGNMNSQYNKELHIDASVDKLPEVLAFIDENLEQLECPMKKQMQIDVAVEELFVNISQYAYTSGKGRASLQLSFDEETRTLSITFIDDGVPYNPLEKEDPDTTLSAEQRQIGGLGIFMVKKSVDDMIYERKNGQNILTILKKL